MRQNKFSISLMIRKKKNDGKDQKLVSITKKKLFKSTCKNELEIDQRQQISLTRQAKILDRTSFLQPMFPRLYILYAFDIPLTSSFPVDWLLSSLYFLDDLLILSRACNNHIIAQKSRKHLRTLLTEDGSFSVVLSLSPLEGAAAVFFPGNNKVRVFISHYNPAVDLALPQRIHYLPLFAFK